MSNCPRNLFAIGHGNWTWFGHGLSMDGFRSPGYAAGRAGRPSGPVCWQPAWLVLGGSPASCWAALPPRAGPAAVCRLPRAGRLSRFLGRLLGGCCHACWVGGWGAALGGCWRVQGSPPRRPRGRHHQLRKPHLRSGDRAGRLSRLLGRLLGGCCRGCWVGGWGAVPGGCWRVRNSSPRKPAAG